MPLGKLIDTKRTINVYKKSKGNIYEEQVDEIEVDSISLETLKTIVIPNNDDPFLYDGYSLDPDQINKLNLLIGNRINIDHNLFEYALECYGIYE